MENSNLGNLMETAMQNLKSMVDTNTIVGEPIYTPDGITLVPVSRVSMGFGGAGAEFAQNKGYGGGTGCGVKVEPIGFLIVKDGSVRMMNVIPPANNTVDRIIDLVPTVIDRVDLMVDKIKDNKEEK
ncbi:MAG TPA: spore germination protein GerW family protein [Oscillospiraceae bacterium]|nr:spore germination protein GerW family protein [Oscillospiraceae bacterium]HNX99320.1 spore germination protein GerW family protein [Oscillospiraceae bacterium]HPS74970.1 spore germination protein GerW family protein [Oscillospiraceae bacterium]